MNRKVQLVFGSAIVVLLVGGAILYHSIRRSTGDVEAKRRSSEPKALLILRPLLGLLIAATVTGTARRTGSGTELAEALRDSEEKYRMLLDGIQNYSIFMMDPRGQILSWNAGAERIKGYSADEIIGRNFSCFFPSAEIELGSRELLQPEFY